MSKVTEKIVIETKGHLHVLEDGILHIYVKPVVPSKEIIQDSIDVMRKLSKDKSLLILVDPSDAIALNREQRLQSTNAFNEMANAIAMINQNMLVLLMHRIIVKFNRPKFQMKLFKTKDEAVEWLKTFE